MIQVSVKVLAQFMRSHSKSSLRDSKYPKKEESRFRPSYYSAALSAIKKFHRNDNAPAILHEATQELLTKKAEASTDNVRDRIDHNIRVIDRYRHFFAHKKLKVQPLARLKYTAGEVTINATPDLSVEEEGTQTLIKFDFSESGVPKQLRDIILQVTHEAAVIAKLPIRPDDVRYVYVEKGQTYTGGKIDSGLQKEIREACNEIQELWPEVT